MGTNFCGACACVCVSANASVLCLHQHLSRAIVFKAYYYILNFLHNRTAAEAASV